MSRDQKPAQQLRDEFLALISTQQSEQTYQNFLENNPRLIPREFVQNHGVHFNLVLRKLSFGADYKTDFCYLSKSSDDWNCVLVEIEKPTSQFFKKASNDFHSDFLNALQQINKWKAWFLRPSNKDAFVNETLGPLRIPLEENPTFMKFVVVLGRRSEYGGSPLRRSLVAAQETEDLKIITFDSLIEDVESRNDLYVGIRHNEFIEITSEEFIDDGVFAWMQPEQLQITTKLKNSILSARRSWTYVNSFAEPKNYVLDDTLTRIRIVEGPLG